MATTVGAMVEAKFGAGRLMKAAGCGWSGSGRGVVLA
jgi:hypothetical protein